MWNMFLTQGSTPYKCIIFKHLSNPRCLCQVECLWEVTKLSVTRLTFDHQKLEDHITSIQLK